MRLRMKLILEIQRIIKECLRKKHRKFLRKIVRNLDLIAKTLLEVETLMQNKLRHLHDHGNIARS